MRCIALIAALACATSAYADGSRESRYGPAPDRAPVAANGRAPGYTGQAYSGRALGWSGKREIVAPTAEAAAQAQPWWARGASQAAPQPRPQQPVRAAYQPQAPAYAPPARDLPQNIYDAPPPSSMASASLAPIPAAYAAPVQPPQQQSALRPGQIGARTYSVGRQFGMTPDAIPAAGPPRMVLIAPPASAPEDDDKPRDEGDWPAQGSSGKNQKDSDR